MIEQTLSEYNARLSCEGYIERKGRQTEVKPVIRKNRIRFESPAGTLIASGPVKAEWVREFVEKYWYWTKGE